MSKHSWYSDNTFIPPDLFQRMKEELPPMDAILYRTRSHKDLFWDDNLFKKLRAKPAWHEFIARFYTSPYWWREMWDRVNKDRFDDLKHDPWKQYSFNSYYFESRGGRDERLTDRQFLYPRIDIGYGGLGYGKDSGGSGPHIDFPQRLISILWYFTHQSELEGGEFILYGGPPDHNIILKTPIVENKAIVMRQDADAWHGVNPVTKMKSPRVAVYMALNCTEHLWTTR